MREQLLKFNSQGLIPAVVRDAGTGDVLMVAYMSGESLRRTLETGQAWFYSRSRRELWHKGATSGNYLNVKRVQIDCDGDTVLLTVEPVGPVCHTGERTCFFQDLTAEQVATSPAVDPDRTAAVMEEVFAIVQERQRTRPEKSYTTYLLDQGIDKIGKKIGEEAAEVIIAAKNGDPAPLAMEMADLWFHSLVMLAACGLTPDDVWSVLRDRRK